MVWGVNYWGVLYVVQVGYGLGGNTVLVSGCFGARCSVLSSAGQRATVQRESELGVRGPEWFYQPLSSLWRSTVLGGWAEGNGSKREWAECEGSWVILPAPFLSLEEYSSWRLGRGQRFKERVSWVWGVLGDFTSPFPLSGGVQFLEAGQRATVQRESELGVRGPEWFYQPLSSLWRSTVLGGWAEGNGSKREWAGCEGSRMILPAPFLSLEEYSSWRLGRGQRFKERVSWVWGVQSDFTSPFPLSGGVQFLEAGQRGTDNPLSSPDCPV